MEHKINPIVMVVIAIVLLVVGGMVILGMNERGTMNTENSDNIQERSDINETMEEKDNSSEEEETTSAVIEVEGGAFYFEPDVITAKVGEPITITLNSVDMSHDFVIDELNVRTQILPGGESETFTFTPGETGEFEFYCSVGNHREQGMVGTLIVLE